jgi:hypothetical protein
MQQRLQQHAPTEAPFCFGDPVRPARATLQGWSAEIAAAQILRKPHLELG